GGDGPPKVGGTPAEVVGLVNGLQRALVSRDYQAICDSLFTQQAREAAGGDNCPSVLAQAGAKVASPTLSIRTVAVAGDQATASVSPFCMPASNPAMSSSKPERSIIAR